MPQEQITPEQPDLDDDIYDDEDLDLGPVYPEDLDDDSEIVQAPIVGKEVKTPKKGPAEALASIVAGDVKSVAYGLVRNEYKNLTTEVAEELISAGEAHWVAWRIKQFKGLTSDVANELIDAGEGGVVSWYPNRFEGLDHDSTILRLVSAKEAELKRDGKPDDKRSYMSITRNLQRFTLKPETLDELERQGFTGAVASYRADRRHYGGTLTSEQRLARTLAHLSEQSH